MKVLVTGAAGFIGTNLVKALAQKGHSVTGLVHNNPIQIDSVDIIKGDLNDEDLTISDSFDVVYHLAAVTPMEKNKKKVKKVNYDGTVNFFEKIKDKTKFLVYASGLGAFGDQGEKVIDENSPLNPHTDYSKVRVDTQRYLESKCKENNIAFTVVYFGEVYGNGGWFVSQIIDRIKSGKFKLPKAGNYYRSVVHIDDVVSSLITIAEKKAYNESFIITDSNPVLFRDFINFTCDKLGVKHPGSIPTFLAKTILGGDLVNLLTTSIKTSNKKILGLCNFSYPSYKEGIENVISQIQKS